MLIGCGVWERGVKSEVNSGVRFREFNSEGNMFGSCYPAELVQQHAETIK